MIDAHGRRIRRAAAIAALLTLTVAPVALAALQPKTTGGYSSSSGHRKVSFNVIKKGGKYKVANFAIYCRVSSSNFGAILVTKNLPIASSGKFSYTGKALHIAQGAPAGSAMIKLSGKFETATKVVGKASFTQAKLTGCPQPSYTAHWSKSG